MTSFRSRRHFHNMPSDQQFVLWRSRIEPLTSSVSGRARCVPSLLVSGFPLGKEVVPAQALSLLAFLEEPRGARSCSSRRATYEV